MSNQTIKENKVSKVELRCLFGCLFDFSGSALHNGHDTIIAHVASKLQTSLKPVVPMPAKRDHRQRARRSNNPGYKVRVQGALEHVASGKYRSD